MFLSSKTIICVVMGAGNDEHGTLDCDGIDRCEMLLEVYKCNPEMKYILCGGNGDHFNTTKNKHYSYLLNYLESKDKNIASNCIGFVDSYNTIDDVKGSLAMIETDSKNVSIVAITSDYHVARTSYLFSKHINNKNSLTILSKPSSHPKEWARFRYQHEYKRIEEYLDSDENKK